MKLFSTPGTCALSPHIVLNELDVPFTLEQVDLAKKLLRKDQGNFWDVSAKGYVPAIQLDDGTVVTEGAVIVQFLADKHPEKKLAPQHGTLERVRLQEWLNFIATELHKGQSPLYNAKANDEYKTVLKERLEQRFGVLAKHLEGKQYVMGERFGVADAYAFYALRAYQKNVSTDFSHQPVLKAYYARLAERPSVKKAVENERQGL